MKDRAIHIAIFVSLSVFMVGISSSVGQNASAGQPVVSVFKTPTCGCCSKWVDHMRANGFELKVQDVDDIAAVKEKLGVAPEISSCHTSHVSGYVIEGHVPATTVQRLLKERPKVAGLTVPGMPAGSPGMEVPSGHREPYAILTFDKSGRTAVYERR
jgi:hypothetical protein